MTSGPYGNAARAYVEAGVAVFPTRNDDFKKPAIKRPKTVGLQGSLDLIPKFETANVGFWCGRKNSLTLIDVDEAGDAALADAVHEFGDTPIKTRTASGKSHLWFRHNGELRKIRPIDGAAIDVLGDNGLAVGPPSEVEGRGAYAFLQGGLDDLERLPVVRPGALPEAVYGRHEPREALNDNAETISGKIPQGRREAFLFREARRVAGWCATEGTLRLELSRINEACCEPPLPDEEVMAKAQHVWQMKTRGQCYAPGGETFALITSEEAAQLHAYPLAFVLLHFLRSNHADDHEFAVSPRGLAKVLPQTPPTIRNARDVLWHHRGFLILTHRGGREDGDAHKFRFSTPAERARFQARGVGKEF